MSEPDRSIEYVVLRPAGGDITESELASVHEGEWRKRADLDDDSYVELDSPNGLVRAYPTDRREHSPAGDVGQVYEVPGDDDDHDQGLD